MNTFSMLPAIESAIWDEWHVLCALTDLTPGKVDRLQLLGTAVAITLREDGELIAWRESDESRNPLTVRQHCGYAWTTLGHPRHALFEVPEYFEPDRRLIHCGTFGVQVSAPRAVENFLDLAHFPFVHTGYLGQEPHTEVKDYEVTVTPDQREVIARRCRFFQPLASLAAKRGFEVEYVYRVPHPYCSVLYKSCALDPSRNDVIAIFACPCSQESIRASLFMAILDDEHTDFELRQFQQIIFGQDKPVLENQRPRRLPLNPGAELTVRADRSSVAYRRWLCERGVRYGTTGSRS
jgi:phenylpropionate dioxygenase-like ring-hydroxylating dioxygenase large terminal subunit